MKKLQRGLHKFQTEIFDTQQEMFRNLLNGQKPEALLITCSDSRIDPNLLTQTRPGDLFILRNAGNIVPLYETSRGGEAATIEFAVEGLNIRDIIICGHSHCGAMKALIDPKQAEKLPAMQEWLKHAEETSTIVKNCYQHLSGDDLLNAAIEENVLVQLENLRKHPAIARKLEKKELHLHAWVYHFESGEVTHYSAEEEAFVPLLKSKGPKERGADRVVYLSPQLKNLKKENVLRAPYRYYWILFCLQGGVINACAVMAFGQFVSHMTGISTRLGIQLFHGNFTQIGEFLAMPLAFVIGAFISGLSIDGKRQQGKKPLYALPMIIVSILLFITAFLGDNLIKGGQILLDDLVLVEQEVWIVALLSFICGLQNGAFSSVTSGLIRITHITGDITDLGLGLARFISMGLTNKKHPQFLEEKKWVIWRVQKVSAFVLGASLGCYGFKLLNFGILVFPALCSLFVAIIILGKKIKIRGRVAVPVDF